MADKVYTEQTITIGEVPDEFNITIRPNPISRQRKFMDRWDANLEDIQKKQKAYEKAVEDAKKEGKDEDSVDESKYDVDRYDGYIELAAICLQKQLADHVVDEDGIKVELFDNKGRPSKQYREFLEDVLDQDTTFRIIEVCGGIKLNDPNLIAAQMEAMDQVEQSGQI